MCRKLCHLIWGIWWFLRLKVFEAMKAGKLAIWPWLSCQYTENTSSMLKSDFQSQLYTSRIIRIYRSLIAINNNSSRACFSLKLFLIKIKVWNIEFMPNFCLHVIHCIHNIQLFNLSMLFFRKKNLSNFDPLLKKI